jgi:hypothetical protein
VSTVNTLEHTPEPMPPVPLPSPVPPLPPSPEEPMPPIKDPPPQGPPQPIGDPPTAPPMPQAQRRRPHCDDGGSVGQGAACSRVTSSYTRLSPSLTAVSGLRLRHPRPTRSNFQIKFTSPAQSVDMSGLKGIRSVCCMLATMCAGAHAQPDALGSLRLEIDTLRQWEPGRRDFGSASRLDVAALPSQRLLHSEGLRAAFADDGLRARWWWGQGALEIGGGADWVAPSTAGNTTRPWSQVLGVRAALSARTRLIYEAESTLPWRNAENNGAAPRTTRVALEFKSKSSPVGDLRNGLMRVQLSSESVLQFKPRSGGLQIMYRERF